MDLTEIAYDSFVLQYDRKTQYSAADFVYCLNSILDSPKKFGNFEDFVEESKSSQLESKEESADDILQGNFWAAYDALNECNHKIIQKGIELAIEMQIAIVGQGTSLILKRGIYPTPELYYAIIQSENLQAVKYFHGPLGLQKLAVFTMEAHQMNRKKQKIKPLVLCILNSQTNMFLVVGVTGTQGMTELPKNSFGIKFRKAAFEANARIKHDGFETSIIEILKDDFQGFIDELCSKDK